MGCKSCKDIFDFPSNANAKIALWSYSTAITASGGETVTWAKDGDFWAYMRATSGREVFLYGNLDSKVSHVITIRYQSGLKDTATAAKHKIIYDGRTFVVNYVRNLDETLKEEGFVFQELLCEENAPEFGDA